MIQALAHKIYFDWMGWTENVTVPLPEKYVIALAPHTSNWDFIIGQIYSHAIGLRSQFMMKSEWFFWPMGYIMRSLGGIPVKRSKNMRSTEIMAEKARQSETFRLCITPEGTRSATEHWKTGFYYIAMGAEIPILLYAMDYENKKIECTKMIMPSGDIDNEMAEIKDYYRKYKGKKEDKFLV